MSYKDSMIGRVIWTVIRVWVGWQWVTSGWEKLNSPVWVGSKSGVAIEGFLHGAMTKSLGLHPDVQAWYAWFVNTVAIPNGKLFSYIIAYGEFLAGVGILLGFLTVPALIAAALMNLNYLLAGTVSTNPILLVLEAVLLFVGAPVWYFGLDAVFWPYWKHRRLRQKT
ncbi:MAG: DoxX family membrane protein [Peptococcaceae bacterium]|nr:DoxX family membrane protein [Peptococcaceae bacterium]